MIQAVIVLAVVCFHEINGADVGTCLEAKGVLDTADMIAKHPFPVTIIWYAYHDSEGNELGNHTCVQAVRSYFQAKQNTSITIVKEYITKYNTISSNWEEDYLFLYPDSFTGGKGWVGADADGNRILSYVKRTFYADEKTSLQACYANYYEDDSRKECKAHTIVISGTAEPSEALISKGIEETRKAGIKCAQFYNIIPQDKCPEGRPVERPVGPVLLAL